jgi:starch synthase
MSAPLRVLYVTSECAPWIKTGGLADVSAALPPALEACGVDVRILMPLYASVRPQLTHAAVRAQLPANGPRPAASLVEAPLPSGTPAWLLDAAELYERDGGPYVDATGRDWPDNARRFAALARTAADIARGVDGLDWVPDVVHAHDWQAGLAPAYVHFDGTRAATMTTIHNLAFQGIFPADTLRMVGLPPESWSIDGVEYYGQLSFLKAGLYYADAITTVSPTYAEEIRREPLGMGLQGLLAARRDALTGILNGIDTATWDPARDAALPRAFDASHPQGKATSKRALQARAGLPQEADVPLLAMVSRLTEQKGVDLVLALAEQLRQTPLQLVVLGTGDRLFEEALLELAEAQPLRVSVRIGFDEAYAHLIEGGADIFLMPSRFEPCGMNQMYSQRYGTIPVVHGTGGLRDSVIDCAPETLADKSASGFVFDTPTLPAFAEAVQRALTAYADRRLWRALQKNGMARDFSWAASARKYADLYGSLAAREAPRPDPA